MKSLPYSDLDFLQEVLATDPRFQEIMQGAASQLDGVRFARLLIAAQRYLADRRSDREDKELDELREEIQAYLGVQG